MSQLGAILLGAVALSHDGRHAAVATRQTDVVLDRDVERVVILSEGDGFTKPVVTVADARHPRWSPDGKTLATLARTVDGPEVCRVVDMAGYTCGDVAVGTGLTHLAWGRDGVLLAVRRRRPAEPAGGVELATRTGRVRRPLREAVLIDIGAANVRPVSGAIDVASACWADDGLSVLVSSIDERSGVSCIWRVSPSGQPVQVLQGWSGPITWVGQDDGSVLFAGADSPGPARLTSLWRMNDDDAPRDLLAGLDRRIVVTASGENPAAVATHDGLLLCCVRDGGAVGIHAVEREGASSPGSWYGGRLEVVRGLAAADAADVVAVSVASARSFGELRVLDTATRTVRSIMRPNAVLDGEGLAETQEVTFGPPDAPLHGYLMRGRRDDCGGPEAIPRLLVDVHGGPDNVWRPEASPHYLYRQELCVRGWDVLLLNPRGSDGYGLAHMRSPMTRLGFTEEQDFTTAVQELHRRGIAAPGRAAIMGSSHGGYLTCWMTSRTELFRTGIAVGCIANWTSLYGTSDSAASFVEAQMGGTPQERPETYWQSSPLAHVDGARQPLLLIHGEQDSLNPLGQALEMQTALKRRDVHVELQVYPGVGHLFMYDAPASVRLDYARRVVEWLEQHVPASPPPRRFGRSEVAQ